MVCAFALNCDFMFIIYTHILYIFLFFCFIYIDCTLYTCIHIVMLYTCIQYGMHLSLSLSLSLSLALSLSRARSLSPSLSLSLVCIHTRRLPFAKQLLCIDVGSKDTSSKDTSSKDTSSKDGYPCEAIVVHR